MPADCTRCINNWWSEGTQYMYLCTLPDTIGWSNRLEPSCCGVLEAKSLLGMPCHKMSLLHSVMYTALSPDYRKRQTTYILQTLWRDLTSDFDIIGPHFTNDATFPHHFLCSILMESIHQFRIWGGSGGVWWCVIQYDYDKGDERCRKESIQVRGMYMYYCIILHCIITAQILTHQSFLASSLPTAIGRYTLSFALVIK